MNEHDLLLNRFVSHVEELTDEPFTQDPFLLACLDEAVRLCLASTVNEHSFQTLFDDQSLLYVLLLLWAGHVSRCFAILDEGRLEYFEFHGELVPDDPTRRKAYKSLFCRLRGLMKHPEA